MRSIAGDRLEESRIRLERDLASHIPSPHMSYDDDDDDDDDASSVSSVDLPRHNAHPSFHSFEHPSHLDSDFYSRHGDDDSFPGDVDLAHTMSTAAHHASALTLSAGLRGRADCRASPSAAEFDPERPLQAMLDRRLADGLSLFDASARSKSKSKPDQTRSLPTYDPVVVDSTAELDRFLKTGHSRPPTSPSYPYISRSHSQPDPSASASENSAPASPRLAHALGHHFSPKRPRSAPVSAQHHAPPRPANPTPIHKLQPGPSNLNPAKHRARDHEHENDPTPRPPPRPAKRAPFGNIVNKDPPAPRRSHTDAHVHLPDVTGLTSAVQSPVKGGAGYISAEAAHPSLAADLLPALDALHTRLHALERANGVSRRRVTELELELEECKAEVTRVRDEGATEKARQARGMRAEEGRYRAVVEEKKALEALIATLRTHLARLTAELASHKTLIADLRSDVHAAGEVHAGVAALRAEVERLAGEVERLKGVVEEGLRERRRARMGDGSGSVVEGEQQQQLGIDLTYVTVPVPAEQEQEHEEPLTVEDLEPEQEQPAYDDLEPTYAHAPEPDPEPAPRSRRYIQPVELARVESEMRERRSERSLSSQGSSSRGNGSRRNDSGNGSSVREIEPEPGARPGRSERDTRPLNMRDARDAEEYDREQDPSPASSAPRPPVQSSRSNPHQRTVTPPKQHPPPSTPFPQIRGSRMERLFFSAPEHNARTCAVCHRRKREPLRPGVERERDREKAKEGVGRDREREKAREEEEEEEEEAVKMFLRRAGRGRGAGGEAVGKDGDGDGDGDDGRLPPQTVLARVVRELEDDFSHYKAIYLELAEQYGVIDAASNVAKRNVLADHLRDVIDTLEGKGDQIAALYELLTFRDKPLPQPHPNSAQNPNSNPKPRSRVKHAVFG